jgi:plasmid stability protein
MRVLSIIDMHIACDTRNRMSTRVQIRNVPDDLHRRLKSRAALEGKSLSEYLLGEIRQVAERPTMAKMLERLASREPVITCESSVDALEAERASRDRN